MEPDNRYLNVNELVTGASERQGWGCGGWGDQGWRKSVAFQSAFSLSLQTPSGSFLVVSSDEAILSCLVVHALNS